MKYLWLLLFSTVAVAQPTPKFWTHERIAVTSALVVESAIDGYTTQKIDYMGYREADPLAAPLVNRGNTGQAVACVAGVGTVLGMQYLTHKLRHEHITNWLGRIAVGGEGANVVRQIHLYELAKEREP